MKPFVRQDPLRFTRFNGDESVNFGFKTLVLLRKTQITFPKVQIHSYSDCFRGCLCCLAVLAGRCQTGAFIRDTAQRPSPEEGRSPSLAWRAVGSHRALEGTWGGQGLASRTHRATRVAWTPASKPRAARAKRGWDFSSGLTFWQ